MSSSSKRIIETVADAIVDNPPGGVGGRNQVEEEEDALFTPDHAQSVSDISTHFHINSIDCSMFLNPLLNSISS